MTEILKIVERIKSGESSARAEVEAALNRADADDRHSLLEIIRERALARADEIDEKINKIIARHPELDSGSRKTGTAWIPDQVRNDIEQEIGKLAGVPFVAKDNFLTLGSRTTAASKILENFESPLQATAVERLENAGAICIGKANLDAFAHGGSTENSAFGPTKNAVDDTRVAGGSSGGSAVAVASGIVPFALGSDTGGSIRQPASFNGVVGYKPTYGMIPRYGVVAMASSTDVVGPIARSAADIELLCDILAGPDGRDSTVLPDYFRLENVVKNTTDDITLRELSVNDGEKELEYIRKVPHDENGFHSPANSEDLTDMKAFKKWLKIKADESNGLNPTKKTDFIPMTVFWVEKNSEIVGLVKMRHCLNERTEKYGGHIGIGGVPERFRGQGIGTKTLGLACQKLFEMGENKVLLTAHENNVASRAVIEKNGGKFEDMLDDPEYENTKLARYWIESSVVKNTTPKKLKIGVIKEFMGDGVDEDVKERTRQFVKKLTAVGHSVSEVSLPMVKYALPIYYIVVPAEISSNLARYDGVRYGARSGASKTLAEVYGQSRDAGFVDENKRRIMIGSYVLSSGFFDAYYLQAQKARTLLIAEFDKLFAEYDFLIGPVAPTPAYKIGENISDPIKMYLADIMTVPASLAGLPAISLPNGADKNGLPIGLQIIGPMKSDAKLLDFAKEAEE